LHVSCIIATSYTWNYAVTAGGREETYPEEMLIGVRFNPEDYYVKVSAREYIVPKPLSWAEHTWLTWKGYGSFYYTFPAYEPDELMFMFYVSRSMNCTVVREHYKQELEDILYSREGLYKEMSEKGVYIVALYTSSTSGNLGYSLAEEIRSEILFTIDKKKILAVVGTKIYDNFGILIESGEVATIYMYSCEALLKRGVPCTERDIS